MRSTILLGVLALLILSACQKPQPTAYDVEKIPITTDSGVSFSSKTNQSKLKYKLPPGWQETDPGAMRVASFKIPIAGGQSLDLAVTTLSGPAGGLLANVNRWRGQVGLAPISAPELPSNLTLVSESHHRVSMVDIVNPQSQQMVLAGVIEAETDTWFFKLMGPAPALKSVRPAFMDFIKSVELH